MRRAVLLTSLLLYLAFQVSGQKKIKHLICKSNSAVAYKYGFASYKSGFAPVARISLLKIGNWGKISVYNYTLPQLYAVAFGAGTTIPFQNIIVDVRHPQKMEVPYCYELNTPPAMNDVIFSIMKQNLEYKFPNYVAALEQKNGRNYLVIKDKDWGILLCPDETTVKRETTY